MENNILNIIDLTHDGRGVAKQNGRPVFIKGAYPGETVIANIVKDKKSFLEGELQSVLVPSADRIDSVCEDFGHCGGCDFCDYKYESQLEFKSNRVKNDLKKFAGLDEKEIEIHGMDSYINHRNHVQLSVKDGTIGYNKRGTNEVFMPKNCIIAPKATGEIKKLLTSLSELRKINLIGIRENFKGDVMLILVTRNNITLDISPLVEELKKLGVTHIYQNLNDNPRVHYGKNSVLLFGYEEFVDKILGFNFEISPTSFFQVNRPQGEILYKIAIDNLELTKDDKILELYSGIGTMTLPVARLADEVLGIEYSQKAVQDAKKNAVINNTSNVRFKAGKAEELIKKVGSKLNKILLDPPRSGAAPEVIEAIKTLNPERIVYVSCNPATLSRDIKLLIEEGQYKVKKVDAVDMFGLSYHIECVIGMQRKDT